MPTGSVRVARRVSPEVSRPTKQEMSQVRGRLKKLAENISRTYPDHCDADAVRKGVQQACFNERLLVRGLRTASVETFAEMEAWAAHAHALSDPEGAALAALERVGLTRDQILRIKLSDLDGQNRTVSIDRRLHPCPPNFYCLVESFRVLSMLRGMEPDAELSLIHI